jgi:hypothetical protein
LLLSTDKVRNSKPAGGIMKIFSKIRPILFLIVSLFIIGLVSTVPCGSIAYADSGTGDPMPKTPADTTGPGAAEPDDDGGSILDPLLDLLDLIF